MFNKILLGYDGSPYARKALMIALDLAKKYGAEVTAVSIAHIPDFADSRDEVNGVLEDARRFFEKALEEAKTLATQEGIAMTTRVVPGHPADTLARLAEEEGYDLIILGARGLSGIKRFLLGSVSEAVVRLAKCPVLIVKGKS
ncbi:Nucleotide-binding universal stress protein, UspA family [Thermanaeromonas toyohensis ToBE]|uniref:Nucleotide-binding universal stress protein, UspA family n=1 Tax=Thermanaeromonas toyohensis ToBE TaxID=698762 RepID=A0A1W1W197_9FIRM|nr:universal stress protein [Thermanaeromonas toyohensis]SMB99397.1 Nucleotide-binding universal stress protein, UspA family [Thermanaeromonas toyohensis ToBE]